MLIELIMVVVVIGLMTAVASIALTGRIGPAKLQSQARDLIKTFEMARDGAARSENRYAIRIDFIDQTYTLREIPPEGMEKSLSENPIIKQVELTPSQAQFDYVYFDDGTDSRFPGPGRDATSATFLAGRAGWQNGGKIVLIDQDGNPWSIIVNRIGRNIELVEGDSEIFENVLKPRSRTELIF
ncbi:type II secretion system protein H [Anaerohalosphaera lusitana]|uniref:Type II secretion system protein H n=1 Tax=Anaerohalosphaera lusitana TaxID=1936003 RepID=A0A1U9NP15_9BACT|nr:type II secretion system protein H [Anaerohalosphaera lusitana]